MDLPPSVRVAAFDIKIEPWSGHDSDDQGKFGLFSARQQTVWVDSTLKPQKLLDTVLHELGHAIYWAYGIDDEDKEERIVGTFATAWAQILRDNPCYHEWLGHIVREANA